MDISDEKRELIQGAIDNFTKRIAEEIRERNAEPEEESYQVVFDFDDTETMGAFVAWFMDSGGEYDMHKTLEMSDDMSVTCEGLEDGTGFKIRRDDDN